MLHNFFESPWLHSAAVDAFGNFFFEINKNVHIKITISQLKWTTQVESFILNFSLLN